MLHELGHQRVHPLHGPAWRIDQAVWTSIQRARNPSASWRPASSGTVVEGAVVPAVGLSGAASAAAAPTGLAAGSWSGGRHSTGAVRARDIGAGGKVGAW
jgi:hypothetical protein